MTVVTPIVRRNVDLPDMFEPVIEHSLAEAERDRVRHGVLDERMADVRQAVLAFPRARKDGLVQSLRPARSEATLIALSTSPIAVTRRKSAGARARSSLAPK